MTHKTVLIVDSAPSAPDVLAFFACGMVYPKTGATHFYGSGTADPLRNDPMLASLRAKARRLQVFAAKQNCATVNLSESESVLPYPRADRAGAVSRISQRHTTLMLQMKPYRLSSGLAILYRLAGIGNISIALIRRLSQTLT
jgi:hypothetical protein